MQKTIGMASNYCGKMISMLKAAGAVHVTWHLAGQQLLHEGRRRDAGHGLLEAIASIQGCIIQQRRSPARVHLQVHCVARCHQLKRKKEGASLLHMHALMRKNLWGNIGHHAHS